MGMAGIVMAAGLAIGPVVGGLVIDSFGWRPMFIGIAVVALVILVGGTMMLKNVSELKNLKAQRPVRDPFDHRRSVACSMASRPLPRWDGPVRSSLPQSSLVLWPSSHSYTSKSSSMSHCCALTPFATRNFRNSAILVT